jgi:two-component system, OmpR family, response regulator
MRSRALVIEQELEMGNPNRILMVEDDPDIQTIAQIALEAVGGFTVQTCSTGKQALETLAKSVPDLILLDVMMPDMDGPAVLQAMRKNEATSKTPIIFMTAKAQPQELYQFKQLGAMGVIPKPFDPMTLADTIRDIWKQAHG